MIRPRLRYDIYDYWCPVQQKLCKEYDLRSYTSVLRKFKIIPSAIIFSPELIVEVCDERYYVFGDKEVVVKYEDLFVDHVSFNEVSFEKEKRENIQPLVSELHSCFMDFFLLGGSNEKNDEKFDQLREENRKNMSEDIAKERGLLRARVVNFSAVRSTPSSGESSNKSERRRKRDKPKGRNGKNFYAVGVECDDVNLCNKIVKQNVLKINSVPSFDFNDFFPLDFVQCKSPVSIVGVDNDENPDVMYSECYTNSNTFMGDPEDEFSKRGASIHVLAVRNALLFDLHCEGMTSLSKIFMQVSNVTCDNLKKLVMGNYLFSTKADGFRVLCYFKFDTINFVQSNMRVINMGACFPKYNGTILDCEVVRKGSELCLIVLDVLRLGENWVNDKKIVDRISRVRDFLLWGDCHIKFSIIYQAYMPLWFFSDVEKIIETEGFVFVPEEMTYVLGDNSRILKWKEKGDTVDFLVSREGNVFGLNVGLYDGDKVIQKLIFKSNDSKFVDKIGKIVECGCKNGEWFYVRDRCDKIFANSFQVYTEVVKSLSFPIDKGKLIKYFKE